MDIDVLVEKIKNEFNLGIREIFFITKYVLLTGITDTNLLCDIIYDVCSKVNDEKLRINPKSTFEEEMMYVDLIDKSYQELVNNQGLKK